MPNYKIIARTAEGSSGLIHQIDITLPNVKSLAKYLNRMVKSNKRVIACQLIDAQGKYVTSVKFLQSEYASQRWLTGYKERLLANAMEIHHLDLKWNSGLKQMALVVKEDYNI